MILLLKLLKPSWVIDEAVAVVAIKGCSKFSSFDFDQFIIKRLTVADPVLRPIGQRSLDVWKFAFGFLIA